MCFFCFVCVVLSVFCVVGFFLLLVIFLVVQLIDCEVLVWWYIVWVDCVDLESVLIVGNGDFVFIVDVIGFQLMEMFYYCEGILFEMFLIWVWYEFLNMYGFMLVDVLEQYEFYGWKIFYVMKQCMLVGEYF